MQCLSDFSCMYFCRDALLCVSIMHLNYGASLASKSVVNAFLLLKH
jgi:hypothetical protein